MSKRHKVRIADFKTTPAIKKAINAVLDKGILSYGPQTKQFETAFANRHETCHGIFVASGTCALHLALQAAKLMCGWKEGDEVIVPSVTFPATINAVIHNSLKPVFVDVDPKTFNMDPEKLDAVLTDRTRAVIPVHLLGLPANLLTICNWANSRNLFVLEDSCETVDAQVLGRPVGTWGHASCFSTYMAHHIVTGVGGLVLTNNFILSMRIRSLMNHGRNPIYLSIEDNDRYDGEVFHEMISKRFQFADIGHSFRCTELEAALGNAQLPDLDDNISKRRRNATFLEERLHPFVQMQRTPAGYTNSRLFFGIVLDHKLDRKKVLNYLEEAGIETRDMFPLITQEIYREYFGPDPSKSFPVAARLAKSGFIIGCHPYLSTGDLEYAVDTIKTALKACR